MKKIFALMFAVAFGIGSIGCGDDKNKVSTSASKKAADNKAADEKKMVNDKAADDKKIIDDKAAAEKAAADKKLEDDKKGK